MKIPALRTIRRDDLAAAGGDLPPWVDPFLFQINSFIEDVGRAVQGNLSFADNFLCKVKQYSLTHGVELEINPDSKIRPIGVVPIDGGQLVIDKFGFTRKNNGNLGLTVYFNGGSSATSSTCTVLILLG